MIHTTRKEVILYTAAPFTMPEPGQWVVYLICVKPETLLKTSGQGCRQSYVGMTNNFPKRLYEHNKGANKSTRGRSWEVSFVLHVDDRKQAAALEQWMKVGDTNKKRHRFQAIRELSGTEQSRHVHLIITEALCWQGTKNLRDGIFKHVRGN